MTLTELAYVSQSEIVLETVEMLFTEDTKWRCGLAESYVRERIDEGPFTRRWGYGRTPRSATQSYARLLRGMYLMFINNLEEIQKSLVPTTAIHWRIYRVPDSLTAGKLAA